MSKPNAHFTVFEFWILDLGLTGTELQFYLELCRFRINKKAHPLWGRARISKEEMLEATGKKKSRAYELLGALKDKGAIDFRNAEFTEIDFRQPSHDSGELGSHSGESGKEIPESPESIPEKPENFRSTPITNHKRTQEANKNTTQALRLVAPEEKHPDLAKVALDGVWDDGRKLTQSQRRHVASLALEAFNGARGKIDGPRLQRLTEKRTKAVQKALDYAKPSELIKSVVGFAKDPWWAGQADNYRKSGPPDAGTCFLKALSEDALEAGVEKWRQSQQQRHHGGGR